MSSTPMMQQYHEAKSAVGDALLLFRMGDFYELFFEDAKIAARQLGLALTSRDKGENPVPMAGFPHHQLDQYLAKIIASGFRAAICEQVEDPKQAKGLVRREVTRVVSRGTLTDDALLDPQACNFLAAIATDGSRAPKKGAAGGHRPIQAEPHVGLAWIDISTGRFCAAAIPQSQLADQLARIQPAECLVSDDSEPLGAGLAAEMAVTARPAWAFGHHAARDVLNQQFGTHSLAGFGFEEADLSDTLAIRAAGAVLDYLNETQKSSLAHVDRLVRWSADRTLHIDPATRRSLEITQTIRSGQRAGSLLGVIDRTVTAMGARLLADWLAAPLTCVPDIRSRLDAVDELVGDPAWTASLREALKAIYDIERLLARVTTGRASPRDLSFVARTLSCLPKIKAKLSCRQSTLLGELERRLDLCAEIRSPLEQALVEECPLASREGGIIRPGHHPELDELRALCAGGKQWMAQYQASEIERTGIAGLKVGFNKVFGYFLEVTHAHRDKVPADYHRKQTLKNAERYITPELKEYEEKVLTADERAKQLEYDLFLELRELVANAAARLRGTAQVLAEVDVLVSLAELARSRNYVRPDVVEQPALLVEDGRHPVLDITEPEGTFVPNSVFCSARTDGALSMAVGGLPEGERAAPDLPSADSNSHAPGTILLITGPNMAGKSTYIRQAALITLLAQIGSFVPARRATIGVADRIFARVGASDELSRGQSTFMVEMTETARILNTATERSLVILDEIGRGTSTYDGLSLAWSIVEHLHARIGCRTLFATHYHELTGLEAELDGVRNWNVAVKEWEDNVVFLHQVVPGAADKSYGIHVAQLAGVPREVNERAHEVLRWLEQQHQHQRRGQPTGSGSASGSRSQAAQQQKHLPGGTAIEDGRRADPAHNGRAGSVRQLTLFETVDHPLLEEIRSTDLNETTPIEALQLLASWQKQLQQPSG